MTSENPVSTILWSSTEGHTISSDEGFTSMFTTTPPTAGGKTDYHIHDNYNYEYDEYMYPGYPFERPIYLYIWEILVVIVSLVNVVVILVLTRKGMRNPTNMILTCIAISDSLTGLVTLPTYIMVYSRFVPALDYDDFPDNSTEFHHQPGMYDGRHEYEGEYSYYDIDGYNGGVNLTTGNASDPMAYEYYSQEGYVLTKELCRAFMLSKFFFSKFFHTISIFLTLFLGFQRFVSVKYPFKSQAMFTMKNTVIVCVVIFVLSPVLHVYHLIKEKAIEGMCEWRIDDCGSDCAFLWIILFVRHLIPCTLLTIFTVLFIRELRRGRLELNKEQTRRRAEENRRVSIIVMAIVIVFLVPEIPYGVFLLSSVIRKHARIRFDLMANRAIHVVYEISLVLSFHANFYIYTFLNKRFRSGLKRTFLYPVRRALGKPARWAISRTWSSRSGTNRQTMESDFNSRTATEMRHIRLNASESSRATLDTKVDSKMLRENSE